MKNKDPRFYELLSLAVLTIVTFLVFSHSLSGEFLNWDDDILVTENPLIRSLDAAHVKGMFTSMVQGLYMPLTLVSFAIEYRLAGLDPFWYHFNNLLLHVFNVLLVYWLARQLRLTWLAALIAGLIFAIHPMRVESVAWVTERKDVLYAFFYLLGLNAYVRYTKGWEWRCFVGAFFAGLLSMLAKPMAVSFPLVLLTLDWLLRRPNGKRLWIEKGVFAVYLIPLAWANFIHNTDIFTVDSSIWKSFLIGVWTAMFYLIKFALPLTLAPLYELPRPVTLLNVSYLLSILTLVGILVGLYRFRRHRWLMWAVVMYVVSIFFLWHTDDVHNKSIVADRYMYLPSLGICLWAGKEIGTRLRRRSVIVALLVVLVFYGWKSRQLTSVWKDNLSLWNYTVRYLPNNPIVYNNRAQEWARRGDLEAALKDANRAVLLDPVYAKGLYNRGILRELSGDRQGALSDYSQVAAMYPQFEAAALRRGRLYQLSGQTVAAQEDFQRAGQGVAKGAEWYNVQGDLLYQQGELDEARTWFSQAIELFPDDARGYVNRGNIHARRKEWKRALSDYTAALERDPLDPTAHYNKGTALAFLGETEEALRSYDRTLELDVRYLDAYFNRAVLRQGTGRMEEALQDYRTMLTLDPRQARARDGIFKMLYAMGRYEAAQEILDEVPEREWNAQWQQRAAALKELLDE